MHFPSCASLQGPATPLIAWRRVGVQHMSIRQKAIAEGFCLSGEVEVQRPSSLPLASSVLNALGEPEPRLPGIPLRPQGIEKCLSGKWDLLDTYSGPAIDHRVRTAIGSYTDCEVTGGFRPRGDSGHVDRNQETIPTLKEGSRVHLLARSVSLH